jgi:hypothetical protein
MVPPVSVQPLNHLNDPGSSLASLWLRVRQDDRPPASIPSTLQTHQSQPDEPDTADLTRLLNRAAAESIDNMKPRRSKQND